MATKLFEEEVDEYGQYHVIDDYYCYGDDNLIQTLWEYVNENDVPEDYRECDLNIAVIPTHTPPNWDNKTADYFSEKYYNYISKFIEEASEDDYEEDGEEFDDCHYIS